MDAHLSIPDPEPVADKKVEVKTTDDDDSDEESDFTEFSDTSSVSNPYDDDTSEVRGYLPMHLVSTLTIFRLTLLSVNCL
jgi:hypothetical protein